jgi:beta-phosphoglucomutase-like phosphatase (HAD superfamily)
MKFQGAIFDVDGVLVDSPYSRASRDLRELMDTESANIRSRYSPDRFTEAVYQQVIAGLPRLAGAGAALAYFGVSDPDAQAERYATAKREHMRLLIESGQFRAFPDAVGFLLAVQAAGIQAAPAASSKNAGLILHRLRLDVAASCEPLQDPVIEPGLTLAGLLDADVCGRDFPRGKPDPAIFLAAADELCATAGASFVVEDSPAGVQAAKAGTMHAVGVTRLGDDDILRQAGADLVVSTLDEVSREALGEGRFQHRGVLLR